MKFSFKTGFKIGITVFLTYFAIINSSYISGLFFLILSALKPLAVGALIAFIVNIPMSFFEGIYFPNSANNKLITRTRRPISLVLALLLIGGVIYLLLALVIPELKHLLDEIPQLIKNISSSDFVTKWIPENVPYLVDVIDFESFDIQSLLSKSLDVLGDSVGGVFNFSYGLVMSAFTAVITTVISFIFSIYLLVGKNKLAGNFKRLLNVVVNDKISTRVLHVISVVNDSFRKFFVGQFTESLILGTLCILGMLLFGFPYATMIGVLIGFTALIPVAGAYIGSIFGFIVILADTNFVTAMLFLVFIIILQQLEGNIIYPKVVGNSVGLPAFWVLVAVSSGGVIGGILGMLFAVPLFASIYKLTKEYVNKKEKACDIIV